MLQRPTPSTQEGSIVLHSLLPEILFRVLQVAANDPAELLEGEPFLLPKRYRLPHTDLGDGEGWSGGMFTGTLRHDVIQTYTPIYTHKHYIQEEQKL